MRYRRRKHRMIGQWPVGQPPPAEVAGRVRYVGSAEHKNYPSAAGNPALRSDASRCDPRYTDFEAITRVLREAIERGCVSAVFEGAFPKYAWGRLDGQLYEARLVNRSLGSYKAYPIEEIETPKDDRGLLNWERPNA